MEKLLVLSSFLKGFKRKHASDIINALFIAKTLSDIECPFTFENRDNNGVDSSEIRRLFFFNYDELVNQKELIKKFYNLGKKMTKLNSNELKWVAQYLKNKDVHLFPNEAERARKLLKELNHTLKRLA